MLDFQPESLKELRGRFPKCLERIWTDKDIQRDERPGLYRTHVFDFENGMRLIISKDMPFDTPLIHISASACQNSYLFQQINHKEIDFIQFCDLVVKNFAMITNLKDITLRYHGPSQKGVPHFWEDK